jgi:UDP-glucose:(heptosyl)LPS alpha-1,3-glucosyltransferase
MKIALVILHADPARGGAERYTVDLAAALARRGHDVTLISSESLGVRGWTRVGRYRDFLDRLDRHLVERKHDIVHAMLPVRNCDIYHPHAGLALEAAQRMSPLRQLVNLRRLRFSAVEQELLIAANPPVVLCLSEYVKRGRAAALSEPAAAEARDAVQRGRPAEVRPG